MNKHLDACNKVSSFGNLVILSKEAILDLWSVQGGFSFETCLRCCRDVLIGCHCYLLFRRCHNVPIRCCGDIPLGRLVNVPSRRYWVFHLGRTCDVTWIYREVTTTSPERLVARWVCLAITFNGQLITSK